MNQCYACNSEGTTVEHAPPISFFPKSERVNLITVPSCEIHNNDNSKDVEYVRNIVTMHFTNNVNGLNHFQQKTFRSFKKSIGLFKSTLKDSKRIKLNGIDTISFGIDLARYDNVMNHLGKALYFRDFNTKFTSSFYIHSYSLFFQETILYGQTFPDVEELNLMLNQTPFIEREVNNPQIFRYYFFGEDNQKFIYKLEFYNGFFVFLLPQNQVNNIVK